MQGKVLKAKAETAVYVGIDTCKAWLDVYLHPIGRAFRVENSKDGLRRLCAELRGLGVALIVIEATGKLHRLAHRMLGAAGFPVAVINPYRSRKLADVLGQLAKTDKIDARILALYGQLINPQATPAPAKPLAELQELVLGRQAAVAEQTVLTNRLAAAESPVLKRLIEGHLRLAARSIAALEKAIAALIASQTQLQRRFEILASIKGIGSVAATTLVACLSELGLLAGGKIALLTGVARSIATAAKCADSAISKAGEPMSERALHGVYQRGQVQSRFESLLCPPARRRQTRKTRSHSRHAKARHPRQHPHPGRSTLDTRSCLTRNTDALPKANACRSPERLTTWERAARSAG